MAVHQGAPLKVGYVHDGPYDTGYLQVDAIHSIHYEQYGTRAGLPVVFLHGGPGGQTNRSNTLFFNPAVYRVVLFDQRGAGKSRPRGEISENTSHHLVADIEKLRQHLGIQQWHMVFGGSWGTTLGLLYTQTYPKNVKSLVLRGVTTLRKSELADARGPNGAAKFFPEMYEMFVNFIPAEERGDIYAAYYKRLTSGDDDLVAAAAREWTRWILTIESMKLDPDIYSELDDAESCLTNAKIETHYFTHGAWLKEGQLLERSRIDTMKHIPGAIVQGRYDLITPPQTAWELHTAWPKSSLCWIDDAGHSASEPGTLSKLVEVCDEFVHLES
ncbi:proline iminopeptidase [Xylariales sp. AK1849]|nr:proline iminopeptidase [Xylariales sp. AK1849]